MASKVKQFDHEYRRQCFDAWYLNGRPVSPARIRDIIPENKFGNKPSVPAIKRWVSVDRWSERGDELDLEVEKKADLSLINKRAEMLRKQMEDAAMIASSAKDFIVTNGFDSSSSAVQAYFKATEEVRKTAGFSDLLEKLESMSDNQVRDEIINLINRAVENTQIVEGSEIDIAGELSDTVSSGE